MFLCYSRFVCISSVPVSDFVSVCCVSGFRSAVVPVVTSDSRIYEPTHEIYYFNP